MKKIILSLAVVLILIYIYGPFPKVIGYKNGHWIAYTQYCSDYCPGYGNSLSSYKKYGSIGYLGVKDENECEQISGRSRFDMAFGKRFIGCFPK